MTKGLTLGMGEIEQVRHRPAASAPYSEGLLAAARRHSNLVGLTADLGKYTDMYPFRDAYPDRYFNVGMAEQALITVAAGLAKTGHIAYATTMGCFATRRAYDFIAIACAHGNADVKIFAALPGITTGYGGTHQAIDDLGLMRSIPNVTVIDPCDATEMRQVAEFAAEIPGTVYCRLLRGHVPITLDPSTYVFEPGRAQRLREGSDIGFVSTGFMTERCLEVAKAIEASSHSAAVLHVPSIKPFDGEAIARFAASVQRLIIVENHLTVGGLTSLVLDALQESGILKPLLKIGIPDRFIECGSVPYLQDKYGLTSERILERVERWLSSQSSKA